MLTMERSLFWIFSRIGVFLVFLHRLSWREESGSTILKLVATLKGIAVEVIGVNIDQSLPARTRSYVNRAGLKHVLDDPEGKTHKALGGRGIPYIVVLDGRQATPENPSWNVVAKFTGLDGAAQVREVVDRIGLEKVAPQHPTSLGKGDHQGGTIA